MNDEIIENMINPIKDQIAPPVLLKNLNHVFYNQIAPLAL
jgi:hypothetical protein